MGTWNYTAYGKIKKNNQSESKMNSKQPDNKEIIHILSKILPKIKAQFFVSSLGLFGSFARNEQSTNSDIDLLVEFEKPVGWEFFELKNYLESKLHRKVDLVTKKALKKQLKDIILNEVTPVE